MAETIIVSTSRFTPRCKEAIEILKNKQQLSHVIGLALDEYLDRTNPPDTQVNITDSSNSLQINADTTDEAIAAFIRTQRPQIMKFETKLLQDSITRKRSKTPNFTLTYSDGEYRTII